MTVLDVEQGHLIRFFHGEEIVAGITDFAREQKIDAAWVQGLGALANAELGYYDLGARRYLRRAIDEETELASLVGNLSCLDGEPFAHLHAVLGRRDFTCLGGHLFRAEAGATVEIRVTNFPGAALHREHDEAVGLNLWALPRDIF